MFFNGILKLIPTDAPRKSPADVQIGASSSLVRKGVQCNDDPINVMSRPKESYLCKLRAAITLVAVVLSASVLTAAGLKVGEWELGHPGVSGTILIAASWGEPGCVAVGSSGEILFSANGTDWQRANSPLQSNSLEQRFNLRDVCFFNGVFIAVGGNFQEGRILWSSDGLNWETAPLPNDAGSLTGLAIGDGRVVAVGDGQVLTSVDGRKWERLADSPDLIGLTFGNGIWVAYAGGGGRYHSTDLITWTPALPLDNPFLQIWSPNDITFAEGTFVLVGGLYYQSVTGSILLHSTDGIQWTEGTEDDGELTYGNLHGVTYANGKFISVGANELFGPSHRSVMTSSTGAVWALKSIPHPLEEHSAPGHLVGIAGADGRPFVAVGSTGEIFHSADGESWALIDPVLRDHIAKVAHLGGKYVAVGGRPSYIGEAPGSAAIFSSSDGLTWSAFTTGRNDPLSDVAFGGGIWVVTGDDGGIFTSTDAVTWTDRSFPQTNNDLRTLVHGAGRFVAFSFIRDRIYHSVNGIDWEVSDGAPVADVRAAASIDGRLIAVGNDGLVATSSDGLNWEAERIHPTTHFGSIAYGKGRYVIGGDSHRAISDDLTEWKFIETGVSEISSGGPHNIVYSQGWFIGRNLQVSRDGVSFRNLGLTPPRPYGSQPALIVGESIIFANQLELWRGKIRVDHSRHVLVIPDSGVEIMSTADQRYRVLESTDLTTWDPQGDWQEGNGDYLFWEQEFSGDAAFWKVETEPLE